MISLRCDTDIWPTDVCSSVSASAATNPASDLMSPAATFAETTCVMSKEIYFKNSKNKSIR